MPARKRQDDDPAITFTGAASSSSKPGPKIDPDSLRSKAERGEVVHLHVLVPRELHRALKVRAAMTETNVSDLVASAIAAHLDRTKV
jgi:chromosomal replication initiation ATPase DnaA